jgi:hypothetical protein
VNLLSYLEIVGPEIRRKDTNFRKGMTHLCYYCISKDDSQSPKQILCCEISSSHGGESEAQNLLGCTAVFLIECWTTFLRYTLPPSSGRWVYVKFLIVFHTEADGVHMSTSNQQLKSPSDWQCQLKAAVIVRLNSRLVLKLGCDWSSMDKAVQLYVSC